jgi:hypothetical protein
VLGVVLGAAQTAGNVSDQQFLRSMIPVSRVLVAPDPVGGRTIEIELGNQSVGSPLARGVLASARVVTLKASGEPGMDLTAWRSDTGADALPSRRRSNASARLGNTGGSFR